MEPYVTRASRTTCAIILFASANAAFGQDSLEEALGVPHRPAVDVFLGQSDAQPHHSLSLSPATSSASSGGFLDQPVRLALVDPDTGAAVAPIAPAAAESAGEDNAAELAKKLQNPVASLISVPFQFNVDTGFGPKDADKLTLNIQPVIPITLNDDWNLIIRTILPVVHLGSLADGVSSETGLGDTVQSFFFSPKEPVGGWIIGFGPVFLWPTATEDLLGGEQWGAGPTFLVLRQESGWTYGLLANHIWSYAGNDDRDDVNATFLQPFISYTLPTYTTIGLSSESTYNWDEGEWTVPLIAQVSQLVKVGKLPVQFSLGGKYFLEAPDGGPEWGIRFTVTFLFPK